MVGQRVFPHKFGGLSLPCGGYGKDLRGRWWARPPTGNSTKLSNEDVIEHHDGTITVQSPILAPGGEFLLIRGVWKQAGDKE